MAVQLQFGQKGKKLINELKTSHWLPPYNDTQLQAVIKEINHLYDQVAELISLNDEDTHTLIIALNDTLQRNKRALLAYLNHRLTKIEEIRWEVGTTIPPHYFSNISSQESRYFKEYSSLVRNYAQSISPVLNLDLTLDKHPPKQSYIEVRALKDCGEIILPESGQINLALNSTHFLRRTEVDHLIRSGALKQTD